MYNIIALTLVPTQKFGVNSIQLFVDLCIDLDNPTIKFIRTGFSFAHTGYLVVKREK